MPRRKAAQPAPRPAVLASDSLAHLKTTDITAFNSQAERRFCELVASLLVEIGDVTPHICYQEASFELNISPATAKRYFMKHTARRARFGVDHRGFVFEKF